MMLTALILNLPVEVRCEKNRWGFGSALGFTTGTVNETVFTMGFNLDYYLDRDFSVDPMMLLGPTRDLFQISLAGAAAIHPTEQRRESGSF